VDLVALGEQELGEIGAVLPVHAGDECLLHDSPFATRISSIVDLMGP
jgi:hypothetical protein